MCQIMGINGKKYHLVTMIRPIMTSRMLANPKHLAQNNANLQRFVAIYVELDKRVNFVHHSTHEINRLAYG